MTRAQRICRKKETFKTVKDAGIRAASHFLNHKKMLTVYVCAECGEFHLTTNRAALGAETWSE